MPTAGWLILGLLVIIPSYNAVEIEDKPLRRHQRSIMDLNSMVKTVTGREGAEFIGYGHWCGLGGAGEPVDSIDECCQIHDLCYDMVQAGVCRTEGQKAVYQIEYKWKKDVDGTASCEEEEDKCKTAVCRCDAMITNCLKQNLDTYNEKHLNKLNIFDILEEANWLTSTD